MNGMNDVFGNLESSVQIELETFILEGNYPKVERIAKRYFRQNNLSERNQSCASINFLAMEHLLLGECDFLSRWVNFDLSELDVSLIPRLASSSMEKGLHSILRGIKESKGIEKTVTLSSSDYLLLFLSC